MASTHYSPEFQCAALDFDYGQVNLKDRDSGLDLEVARFQTTLSRYELRYALGTHLYVLGQMQSYGLPRNVYLEFGDEGANWFKSPTNCSMWTVASSGWAWA